jgi:deazaflavin-dependent oxidoreductase (nitroreductase family)
MNCGRFPTTEKTRIGGYTTHPLGPLAQLVEQGTLNPKVAGSIPARPTPIDERPRSCVCGVRMQRVAERYVAPDWFTRNVFNPMVAGLTRLGISVWGSRVLEVRGRKTGKPRRTPVNLLTLDGTRYLVAPRGHTQWVRNLREAGEGTLLLGRHREHFVGSEIPDEDKEPILRAYLRRWKWEVGQFFSGVNADSTTEELRRIAPNHPIFRVQTPRA